MRMLRRACAASALAWAVALPLATWIASGPDPGWSGPYAFALGLYGVGSLICHQRLERSFVVFGAQMPVCARCAGLYAGAAMAALVAFSKSGQQRTSAVFGAMGAWHERNGPTARATLGASERASAVHAVPSHRPCEERSESARCEGGAKALRRGARDPAAPCRSAPATPVRFRARGR